jgi:hypothetical protein
MVQQVHPSHPPRWPEAEGGDMKLDLLDLFVAIIVAFLVGMWCGAQWERAEQRYNDARFEYPAGWDYERGVKFSRYHGTVAVRFYRGTVSIWRDGRWMKVREG